MLFADRAAAQSLIRGKDGDVSLGWDMPSHRSAAVLCFDEMQVTDPFAAVALKGQFPNVLQLHKLVMDLLHLCFLLMASCCMCPRTRTIVACADKNR